MFRKVIMLSLASITLLGGTASAVTVSATSGASTNTVTSGLVAFSPGHATVSGYNRGSHKSSHSVYMQVNYFPDTTVSHFSLSPTATYSVPVNLSGKGRYYAIVTNSAYSQTKMVQ
ncbi:hypothetical protein [Hazenella coriacea]|uniref:Uncharacterized protein n=1 Tax=Hazenella coriacea TaxID=1179467 RepID=A0A4R3LH86_9BACL|nr:hypothetical protein [Hazenella coriacea]TCS96886.1 hypothetical protein EDD58_101531 [Hazenella coriacea]